MSFELAFVGLDLVVWPLDSYIMFAVQIILCVRTAEESEESAGPAEEFAIILTYVGAQTHTARELEQCR